MYNKIIIPIPVVSFFFTFSLFSCSFSACGFSSGIFQEQIYLGFWNLLYKCYNMFIVTLYSIRENQHTSANYVLMSGGYDRGMTL